MKFYIALRAEAAAYNFFPPPRKELAEGKKTRKADEKEKFPINKAEIDIT